MLTLLPWHHSQWSHIAHARQAGRLAHGLMLKEPAGTGAQEFARYLACSLLCVNPGDNYTPCGECKPCVLYEAGNHPDLQVVQPEEHGRQIKVEQIRDVVDGIMLKSQYAGYKIVIIMPADAMNRSAANTLLKTLEEPPSLSLLILVTHRPERLPVTLRSRCQHIAFQPDTSELSRSWLAGQIGDHELAGKLLLLAKGSPVSALEMYKNGSVEKQDSVLLDLVASGAPGADPVKTAKHWHDLGTEQVLLWMINAMTEMIRLNFNHARGNTHTSSAWTSLQKLTNRLDLYKLISTYDLLMQNYRLCTGQVTYDQQGLLEEFIIHWQSHYQQSEG